MVHLVMCHHVFSFITSMHFSRISTHCHAWSCISTHCHAWSCIFTHFHAWSRMFTHLHAWSGIFLAFQISCMHACMIGFSISCMHACMKMQIVGIQKKNACCMRHAWNACRKNVNNSKVKSMAFKTVFVYMESRVFLLVSLLQRSR